MKKLLLFISLIIGTNVVLAQTFDNGDLKFKVVNTTYKQVEVCGFADNSTNVTSINIPSSVTDGNGVQYTVVYINQNAFMGKTSLTSVIIPNSVTHIESSAFNGCTSLAEVTIPNSVTNINASAFVNCTSLTEVTIPNSVTNIGNNAFQNCSNLTSVTIGTLDNNDIGWITLGSGVFKGCTGLTNFTYLKKYCPNRSGNNTLPVTWNNINIFYGASTNVTLTIPFTDAIIVGSGTENLNVLEYNYTNLLNNCFAGTTPYTWAKVKYLIPEGKTKTLTSDLTIKNPSNAQQIELENNGILKIAQGGQLINETSNNNLGIVEVETASLPNDKWSFIGAPFAGYKLESVVPGTRDISVSTFNYGTGAWSDEWSTIETQIGAGEGFFAWSYATEPTIFTNYGDGMYSPNAHSDYSDYNYDFNSTTNPVYQLNNGDVTVTKTLTTNGGNWMALANPYTFKLDVAKFLADQAACMADQVQGKVIYKFDGTQFTTEITGVINVTEGFFVNFNHNETHSARFKKSQRFDSPANSAKASIEREFVRLAMLDGEREVEVLFAQNEQANEEYDIFDANKLFSPVEIAEPYFVVNNIELVKEEVNTLPYYATMNVKSYGNKEVTFKANYIPEGLAVSIIDGEETIDLGEGVEYTTNIIAGENTDRFKVLIKKSLSISDVEELEVNIYNDNRHINIESLENDLQVEVYNALGQKVLSTTDRNFTLNQVSAGAYVVKAFNSKASKTQKVVVK